MKVSGRPRQRGRPSWSGNRFGGPFKLPGWARQGPVADVLASPVRLGLAATVAATAWSVVRVLVAGAGHVGAMVVAGSRYVTPGPYTSGVPIGAGTGYDGQFYFRIALRPWDFAHTAFGVTFDTLGRLDRITYPIIVWALSAGQHQAVAVMMLVANLLALGAITAVAADLARQCGRHPAWGLLVSGFWGFLWVLGRDLTELTEATFALAGLLALRKRQPVWAGLLLALAVLAREEALVYAGAILASRALESAAARLGILGPLRRRLGPALPAERYQDAAWALPIAAFVGWQLALRAGTGTSPARTSRANNSGLPLVGPWDGLVSHLHQLGHLSALIWLAELVALVLMGLLAALSLRKGSSFRHERIAWAAFGLFALSLAKAIWTGDAGFRSFDDFYVLSALLILSSRQDARLPALGIGAMWAVVAVELAAFI